MHLTVCNIPLLQKGDNDIFYMHEKIQICAILIHVLQLAKR